MLGMAHRCGVRVGTPAFAGERTADDRRRSREVPTYLLVKGGWKLGLLLMSILFEKTV